MIPGFQSGEYEAASPIIAAQQAINVVPELGLDGLKFIGTQGTALVQNIAVRGLYTAYGYLYVASAGTLYSYDGETLTELGSIANDGEPVCFTDNIHELLVVSGGRGYTVQKTTQTFAEIADTDFPNAARCGFLDGYGLLVEKASGRFWFTDIDDFESISGVDFATAEGSPDDLVSLLVDHRELWLFGERSIEIWFNSGDATNPFQRQQFIERGCKGAFSPAKLDNTVFWLGEDLMVYRADGFTPIRVSNHGIEQLISKTTVDPVGYAYSHRGHAFYALNFPGELTVVYDASTQLWHRRQTKGQEDCVYHYYAYFQGKHYVGGDRLYTLEDEVYTHAGQELPKIRTIGPIRTNGFAIMPALTCVFETGKNSDAVNAAAVFLEISDNAGRTYGNRIQASLGTQGEYTTEVKFLGLGGFYDAQRVLKLTVTDDTRYTLIDAYVA